MTPGLKFKKKYKKMNNKLLFKSILISLSLFRYLLNYFLGVLKQQNLILRYIVCFLKKIQHDKLAVTYKIVSQIIT